MQAEQAGDGAMNEEIDDLYRLEKEKIRSLLKRGIWTIEFTKVDGTPSVMDATLDASLMEATSQPSQETEKRPEPPHILRLYATDRQGWRSIVVDNLTKIYRKVDNL